MTSAVLHDVPALGTPGLRPTVSGALLRLSRSALVGILCGIALQAAAQSGSQFEEDFDDPSKPWEEMAIQLPGPPRDADLLPFSVSATATQRFAIDSRALTVGVDGVVRYTMVAVSPSGARNITYEGIRCAAFEKKLYAFGRADGAWSRSRRDKWEPIVRNAANRQQATLAQDYFCDGKTVAGDANMMLDRIRREKPVTSRTDAR
ncbi:MAG: hypothetical protein JWR22_576 [Herminiimonas sp.]|nr:hypothetical protein [Herminiimonas sp.]